MAQSQEEKLKAELEKKEKAEVSKAEKEAKANSQAGELVAEEEKRDPAAVEAEEIATKAAQGVDSKATLKQIQREQEKIPNGPCVSLKIAGRNLSYDNDGLKMERIKEEVIYFPTVGNKKLSQNWATAFNR